MKFKTFGRLEDMIPAEELQKEQIVEAKTDFDEPDEATQEQMRAFAHSQLAKSHPHVHKKLKNYD